jgi:polyisoprenoid-binding protein YceI
MAPTASDRQTHPPTPDTAPALSGRWQVDPERSHARFVARTLAGLVKTPGRFRALSGSLVVDQGYVAGALVIASSSIDTGNRMRDGHLRSRDFFHAGRHPYVRYEAESISGQGPGSARIDGQLTVADTRTRLPLEVTVHAPADGVVELACLVEVDRVELGIRGARGMVPRTVELDVVITLLRAPA